MGFRIAGQPFGGGSSDVVHDDTLTGNGSQSTPLGIAGTGTISQWIGDGSDGALDYDGVATVLGVAPTVDVIGATVYVLTRDIQASSIVIASGITVKSGAFRVFCTGLIDGTDGTGAISAHGGDSVGRIGGDTWGPSSGFYGTGNDAGGFGGSNGTGDGTSGNTEVEAIVPSTTAAAPGANATGQCSGGGGGSAPGQTGGSGGAVARAAAPNGALTLLAFMTARPENGLTTTFTAGAGGGSGAVANTGSGISSGGGAGGGGGWLYIGALHIANLLISVRGGQGGPGIQIPASTGSAAGGGGGGGGGVVEVVTGTFTTSTISVAGGIGGAGAGGGGNGGNGSPGVSKLVILGAP